MEFAENLFYAVRNKSAVDAYSNNDNNNNNSNNNTKTQIKFKTPLSLD